MIACAPIGIATRLKSGLTAALGLVLALAAAQPIAAAAPQSETGAPFIDAHTPLFRNMGEGSGGRGGGGGGRGGGPTSAGADVAAALALMDRFGVTFTILAPPPLPPGRGDPGVLSLLQGVARQNPTRFAFSAGGESLNPLIQSTAPSAVTPDVLRRFRQAAQAIVDAGAAGFGELAAEHFSSRRGNHPYESSPPDHPLFLALADIAAANGMPIELHMEAVPRDMPFPNSRAAGPPNPATVKENITAFERLLDHNPKARIVWVHAGWDLTGERTVPLMRSLLERHPNLYMSVKSDEAGTPRTAPFVPGGGLKPGWIAMLRAFPDRFVIGSDQFYSDPEIIRTHRARAFVNALPPDIARQITTENVKRIYRLPQSLR